MAVYYGIVKDKQIVVEGGVPLADGVHVEVRPQDMDEVDDSAAEEALIQELRAEGLIEESPIGDGAVDEAFEPVVVQGEPLSEQIIRERR